MNKKGTMALVLTILLAAYPVCMFFSELNHDYQVQCDTSDGMYWLNEYDNASVDNAQLNIDNVHAARQERLEAEFIEQSVEDSIKKIDNGELTYKEVFKDVYFAGDSLVAGLSAYGLISSNHLMARVSAHLSVLESYIKHINNIKPDVLILHYGINSISKHEKHAQNFVKDYRKLVQCIKSGSPNTRIIISLIFPVDASVAKAEQFKYIDHFNELLIQMCEEEGIEYLDTTDLLKQYNQYYRSDGIHLVEEFYVNYWFKHIMREMEIYL